jgi:hypothetical protein
MKFFLNPILALDAIKIKCTVDCDFETSITALFSKPENRMIYDSSVIEAKIVEKGFV